MRNNTGYHKSRNASLFSALFCCIIITVVDSPLQAAEPLTSKATIGLPAAIGRLVPLHTPLGRPEAGDWLAAHPESGQTYREYLKSEPVRATGDRRIIYIQPIGQFTPSQRAIVTRTSQYMQRYFGLPVRVLKDLPDSAVPETVRRVHPSWGMEQLHSGYILQSVLFPRLPDDAVAMIGLTASDLWPGEGWNFVFGQASLKHRVGVWSIYRNGDPDGEPDEQLQCLRRTLKIATHETAHMLSLQHCTAFECNMCGSNHQAESDRQPLWLCPHCLAKICRATGSDPSRRFKALIEFCDKTGLDREAEFFRKSLKALGQ